MNHSVKSDAFSIKPALYVARRCTMILCQNYFWDQKKKEMILEIVSKMWLTIWTSCLLRCAISLKIQTNFMNDAHVKKNIIFTVLPYKSLYGDSSLRGEGSVVIYSPSGWSRPVWISFSFEHIRRYFGVCWWQSSWR